MKTYHTWDDSDLDDGGGDGESLAERREAHSPYDAAVEHIDGNSSSILSAVFVREVGSEKVLRYRVNYTAEVVYEREETA